MNKKKFTEILSLKKIKKLLKSNECLCASYAYDYEKNKKDSSLERFYELWNSFDYKEKNLVIRYFYSFNNYEMLLVLCRERECSEIQKLFCNFFNETIQDENIKIKKLNKKGKKENE